MYSIVNLDSMDLIDDELESLETARDMALEYSDDLSPYMVLDGDDQPVGIAYEGVWYVRSESINE